MGAILDQMRVSLLGPVELRRADGERVEIGSLRQRQLLAVLGMYRGRQVDIDLISELMWGEDQPHDPGGTVQTNISRLRRILEPPLRVRRAPTGYLLESPVDHVDIGEFEDLVDQVRAASVEHVSELAVRALNLWRGMPFVDLDHPGVEAERQRLVELRLEIAEERAEALCVMGRHAEAVEAAELLVRDHPYRERPVGIVMRSLYATGRQADALAAFARLRTRLLDDLGSIRRSSCGTWSWRSSSIGWRRSTRRSFTVAHPESPSRSGSVELPMAPIWPTPSRVRDRRSSRPPTG